MKEKFYAIKDEANQRIVTDWEEAKKIIATLNSPKYKSFSTKEEAEAFLEDRILEIDLSEPVAFIDGSYDSNKERYSFGGILLIGGELLKFKKCYEKDEYSSLRNVAGEIKGAGFIIQYAIHHNIKKLHLYYDYIGIEKWWMKEWKAKSSIAIKYVEFAEQNREKIIVVFHKVKSHTNNFYNEMVDQLAKEALGLDS